MEAPSPNHIEELMLLALKEDRQATQEFYEALLLADLFVPNRQQSVPMQHLAQYQEEILNILGIQDGERAIVPVFFAPEHIKEWCGQNLLFRKFSLKNLLEILPAEWWLCINPGREVAKELSPWELGQLKGGRDEIPEILAELFDAEAPISAETYEPEEGEYLELKNALKERAEAFSEIQQLLLLAQKSDADPEAAQIILLIGVLADPCPKERLKELRETLSLDSRRLLIGAEDFRILIGTAFDSSAALALFANTTAFYKR